MALLPWISSANMGEDLNLRRPHGLDKGFIASAN